MRLGVLLFFVAFLCLPWRALAQQELTAVQQLEQLGRQLTAGDSTAFAAIQRLLETQVEPGAKRDSLHEAMISLTDKLSDQGYFGDAKRILSINLASAKKAGNEKHILECQIDLAFNHLSDGQIDSAKYYLQRVERMPPTALSLYSRVSLLNVQAILAKMEGKYLKAIECYSKALDLADSSTTRVGVIKENMGILYGELAHHRRSIACLLDAKAEYESTKEAAKLSRLYSNLGVEYMKIDSLAQAEACHQQAIALSEKDMLGLARGLANLGNVLRRQGRFPEALAVIDSSMRIVERLDIPFGVVINLINRAHVLKDMNRPVEALQTLAKTKQFPIAELPDMQIEICKISHEAYEILGNNDLAYAYLKRFNTLQDSVDKKGSGIVVQEWEERIQRAKKDRELEDLNDQLYQSKIRQNILLLLIGVAILLALAIGRILYFRGQKKVLDARLAEEERENLRLTLEIKERELASQAIHLQAIGGFAEDITGKLTSLQAQLDNESAAKLSKIIRDFENGIPEELWDDFRVRFEKINADFYYKLLQICPELTPVEIKIASFLRLNLSSKEISQLTNRSAGTISNTRSALRKKLKLEEENNLVAFLMSL